MCAIDYKAYAEAGFPAVNKTSMIVQRQLIKMNLEDFEKEIAPANVKTYDCMENDDFLRDDNYYDSDIFDALNSNSGAWL